DAFSSRRLTLPCGDSLQRRLRRHLNVWDHDRVRHLECLQLPSRRPVARRGAVASWSMVARLRKQTSGDATILIPMQILLTLSRLRAFAARRSHLPPSVMANLKPFW